MNLEKKKEKMKPLIILIEQFLDDKGLSGEHRKDEFQKIFSCIIQGKDIVNTFERRKAGITDEDWDESLVSFNQALGKDDD